MKALVSPVVFLALLLVGVIALHVYLLDGLDGWFFSLGSREDTVYSGGYSNEAFRSVCSGMSESELRKVLGTPLSEVWIYNDTTVSFSGGIVDNVHGQSEVLVSSGMSEADVIRALGMPSEKSFVYSKSQHDNSYRVRIVRTAFGIVVKKKSEFYVD